METFTYIMLGSAIALSVFYIGWLFGCMFVEGECRERRNANYNYLNDFHQNYYCKPKAKAKAKKNLKK